MNTEDLGLQFGPQQCPAFCAVLELGNERQEVLPNRYLRMEMKYIVCKWYLVSSPFFRFIPLPK